MRLRSSARAARPVVLDGEYGYLRFPVGGDEADLRRVFHNVPRAVGQAVQYGRVGTHELRFDRVLLEHQVVAFQVDVSIRITPCQVFLYLIHILYQVVRRGEVYNQFAVRQGRIGDAAHQVVASRRAADRGGDVGNLLACFQVGSISLKSRATRVELLPSGSLYSM